MSEAPINKSVKLTIEQIQAILDEWITIESYYDDERGSVSGVEQAAKCIHEAVYGNKHPFNYNEPTMNEPIKHAVSYSQIDEALSKTPVKDEAIAQNCKHWKDGRCSVCGVAHQFEEVAASFHCAYFTQRN